MFFKPIELLQHRVLFPGCIHSPARTPQQLLPVRPLASVNAENKTEIDHLLHELDHFVRGVPYV